MTKGFPKRAPSVLADELTSAFREAKNQTGLDGAALSARLKEFRAGAFYPRGGGHRPKNGLTVGRKAIDPHEYFALRDLDRAFEKWRARPAAGGEADWTDASIAHYVRAESESLPKARAARAAKQQRRAGFDRAEWRALAVKIWHDDIRLKRPAVATTIRDELAKRHPEASAKELPSVRTIEDHIKGFKVIARKGKAGGVGKASQS